jgi:hypothetical protein
MASCRRKKWKTLPFYRVGLFDLSEDIFVVNPKKYAKWGDAEDPG